MTEHNIVSISGGKDHVGPSDSIPTASGAPTHRAIMNLNLNIYRHTFVAKCPADGEQIIYRLEIRSAMMIRVEHIRTATALIKCGFQEEIADRLQDQLGGEQRIVGLHQGVEVETVRLPA